jgi:hypothetical protein
MTISFLFRAAVARSNRQALYGFGNRAFAAVVAGAKNIKINAKFNKIVNILQKAPEDGSFHTKVRRNKYSFGIRRIAKFK